MEFKVGDIVVSKKWGYEAVIIDMLPDGINKCVFWNIDPDTYKFTYRKWIHRSNCKTECPTGGSRIKVLLITPFGIHPPANTPNILSVFISCPRQYRKKEGNDE